MRFPTLGRALKLLVNWRKNGTMMSWLTLTLTIPLVTCYELLNCMVEKRYNFGVSRAFLLSAFYVVTETIMNRYGSVLGATFAAMFPV